MHPDQLENSPIEASTLSYSIANMDLDIRPASHFFTHQLAIPELKQPGFTAVVSIHTSYSLLIATVTPFLSASPALTMLM